MYVQHFGLDQRPFRATATGDDVFVGPGMATTIAEIRNALTTNDAIVTVSGDVGSGKTTLAAHALESIGSARNIVRVGHMRLESEDVLELLLDELGIENKPNGTIQRFAILRRKLKELEKDDTRVFIIIEDGARLGADALAEVEALTAADAGESEGASLVIMGDEDLKAFLKDPKLARIQQRIRQQFSVASFSATELHGYLRHCFRLVGGDFEGTFESNAAQLLHYLGNGNPRICNNLVESALTAAADQNLNQVASVLVSQVAKKDYGFSSDDFDLTQPVEPPKSIKPTAAPSPVPSQQTAPEPDPVAEIQAEESPKEMEIPEFIQDTLPDLKALECEIADEPAPLKSAEAAQPQEVASPAPELVKPVAEPAVASVPAPAEKPSPAVVADSAPTPVAKPAPEPAAVEKPEQAAKPAAESMAKPEPEPAAAAKSEPVAETAPEPAAAAKSEPVAETAPEPAAAAKLEPVAEIAPEPAAAAKPEPVAEPTPEPVQELSLEPEPTEDTASETPVDQPPLELESDGKKAAEWDRDPTVDELKPDLDALEQAMAFAKGPEPEPEAKGEAAEPEPETPEVMPEITLDNAINERIETEQKNMTPIEPTSADEDKTETASESSSDEQNNLSDAELAQIAADLQKANSIEDIDDKLAETLFGQELNVVAAQFAINPQAVEPANEDSGTAANEPAAKDTTEPVAKVPEATQKKEPVAPQADKKPAIGEPKPTLQGDGSLPMTASQRFRTVMALNGNENPLTPKPGQPPKRQPPAPGSSATPDTIEDQINTSISDTQTQRVLNVIPPEKEEEEEEPKRGFFSRFKRS